MSMSNEFSIVIPYHAKPETINFVKRQLNYYHFNPTPMAVILAVSGDEIVKIELEQFIKELNDPRFVILMTNETNIINFEAFLKKIFEALKTVTTPYVIISGADDAIIPEAVCKGIEILANNIDVAAAKGYTINFSCQFGSFLISKNQEILNNLPIDRIKEFMKDRDSIFYIIRRTKDLVREYENIIKLSKKSKIVNTSFYHIDHFLSLSLTSLGKVYVFKCPWQLINTHENNHTSYMTASFTRVELGALERVNYEWFQSVNKNMLSLSYNHYKFLWVCHQIRGISLTLKQIAYHYLYKNCSLRNSARIFTYFLLHKVFILLKKLSSNESMYLNNPEDFFKTEEYAQLKKHYFSEENIKLIESKNNLSKQCKN